MSYSVRLFYNTGFNAINVPGTQSLIDGMTGRDFDALDILQAGMISAVSIRATWSDVSSADYLKIYSSGEAWYYTINGIAMTSQDVARISITLDPFTTIGGLNGISEFLDGITERHHIPSSLDTFGAYIEEDPYLTPSKALEMVSGGRVVDIKATKTLVEATVSLGAMANVAEGIGYQVTGTTDGCVVPQVVPLDAADYTTITLSGGIGNYTTPVSMYFDYGKADVREGVKRLRSLGSEGAILNCWLAPSTAEISTPREDGGINYVTDGFHTVSSGLPFEFATVRNKRILYGRLCQYILVSVASGNSARFDPEDIYGDGASPLIKYVADPRPNGTPHFRFNYFHGDTNNFFENCIQGLPNPTAPLVYYDKSGTELDKITFHTNREIEQQNATIAASRAEFGLASGPVMGMATGSGERGMLQSIIQGGMRLVDWGASSLGIPFNETELSVTSDADNIIRQFNNALAKEIVEFRVSHEVVAPEVNFPRSETLRDFVGNGVYVYRLRPSASDVTKFDKILDMYGYKDTAPISKSMLNNRSKFNYIRAAGVSVKTSNGIPMWLRDLVAAQFGVGLRVWHVAPDTSAYTDGTNT